MVKATFVYKFTALKWDLQKKKNESAMLNLKRKIQQLTGHFTSQQLQLSPSVNMGYTCCLHIAIKTTKY